MYQGFIPTIVPENLMAKSFSRCTKASIERQRQTNNKPKIQLKKKLCSTYQKNYTLKSNRRFCNIHNNCRRRTGSSKDD